MTACSARPAVRTAWQYFAPAVALHGIDGVATPIGLHRNTVQRWYERQQVPPQYLADLARLVGDDCVVDDVKTKDQYFTKPHAARLCMGHFGRVMATLAVDLNRYYFIEPAMGNGSFYDVLPRARRMGIDIEPQRVGVIKSDYLRWQPQQSGPYIVLGNPPFGLRGHLALQFINHSYAFADIVAFILPQLFASDGKGVPAKRVRGYKLADSVQLASDSFAYPDGRAISIHTIFQVWTKINTEKIHAPIHVNALKTCRSFMRVLSLSDGGTPASTRNKKWLNRCDVYLPSTTFKPMQAFEHFAELPHRRGYGVVLYKQKDELKQLLKTHDWNKTAFPSTNSALNLRKSLIEQVIIAQGYVDEKNHVQTS